MLGVLPCQCQGLMRSPRMERSSFWRYRWAVRTCTGFDLVFIRTCFPFPCCFLSALLSKSVMPSDFCPSPITPYCYSLLVSTKKPPLHQTEGWEEREVLLRTEEREKSWSVRLQLLTSNSQKFSGICKRQWWLKVVSVRSSSLSLSLSVCRCVCQWWLVVL